jgi:hypothetical protein
MISSGDYIAGDVPSECDWMTLGDSERKILIGIFM